MRGAAAAARSLEKRIHLGSRVRVVDAKAMTAALRGNDRARPEPAQMCMAGGESTVVGYHRAPSGRALYVLADVRGLWPDEWLDPV